MRISLYLFLILALIISCKSKQTTFYQNSITIQQDGLDKLGKNSKFNNRLKDVYRAYLVRNISNEIDNYVYNQFIINPKYEIVTLQDGAKKKNYYVQYPGQMI
jgi:hypothetical protein